MPGQGRIEQKGAKNAKRGARAEPFCRINEDPDIMPKLDELMKQHAV